MKKVISILVAIALIVGLVFAWQKVDTSATETGASAATSGGLVINEVMTNNQGIYPDDQGDSSDWVELYNSTNQTINLSRYGLSDDEAEPLKWGFPSMEIEPYSYVVVFLTGDSRSDVSEGILHCSFKLSAQGETLVLANSAGIAIDSVAIPTLSENVSYGLSGGIWQQMAYVTPGYENSDTGYAAFLASRTIENPAVIITEVMAANAMTITDPQGTYSDWIEITNVSGEAYDLSGCGLSDDITDPLKWSFPDITLEAGQSTVIFCSGRAQTYSGEGLLEADFKLSANSMVALLSDSAGRMMDSAVADEVPTDWAYAREYQSGAPSDTWKLTSQPTPGYSNTSDGFAAFMQANPFSTGDIVISEVLCSNNQVDFNGNKSDYIEIENRGAQAVSLSGYGLTDDADKPAKFRFPDVTLQPGERIVVLAAGEEVAATNTDNLCAPFKLSRLGATVALFNAQAQLIDRYFIGEVPQNISVGREEGATTIAYFETPTPGAANGDGKVGIASAVEFGQSAGKYDNAIELTLTASEGCDIYYTTDGTIPTESSKKYTSPISIDETTSVRARAFRQDYISSSAATSTYFIDTEHTLTVVSITTDPDGLFDSATGIYANSQKDTEVSASFEMFDESGQCVFQQDIGLAMTGGMTLQLREQKSFAIYARSQYGESTMAYPFFDNREFTEYKSLILRTAGRDDTDTKLSTYVALGLVDGQMSVLTQAAKPCVVYIDGKYWGIYFLMEKRNKYMVAQHEGITDSDAIDSINICKGLSDTLTSSGSYEGYAEIYEYVNSHDLSIQENFDWVAARLNTDSFMDLMINQIYIANNDVRGNLQYYQVPGGLWTQIYQDLDIAFYSFDTVALRMDPDTAGSDIFNALLKNEDWRNRFIERFAWALENIYNEERVIAAVDEAAALIRGEVEADYARWSGERPTLEEWEAGIARMKNFAKIRPAAVVGYLKANLSLTQAQIDMLDAAVGS